MDNETIELLRIATECVRDACIVYGARDFNPTNWNMPEQAAQYLEFEAFEFAQDRIAYEDNPQMADEHKARVKVMIHQLVNVGVKNVTQPQ